MQCLLTGMKIRCCLFCWVHINSPPCLHSSTGNKSISKKKALFVLPAHLANASFLCVPLPRRFFTQEMWQCWGEWCFCFPPPLLPPKTWGMPKPLCNLEGIFILPQGQHVFFPGSPIAQVAQSAKNKKKINQTSPERTAWSDRQLLQKNKSLQASKAVPHQQQKIWVLTSDQVITLIPIPNPISTDVTEEPWNWEDPCENMLQA